MGQSERSDEGVSCQQWRAWFEGDSDDAQLHVVATCKMPSGTQLTLEPGDVGVAPDDDVFALQAETTRGYSRGEADAEVTWSGQVDSRVKRVRIQGVVSAEVDVTDAP